MSQSEQLPQLAAIPYNQWPDLESALTGYGSVLDLTITAEDQVAQARVRALTRFEAVGARPVVLPKPDVDPVYAAQLGLFRVVRDELTPDPQAVRSKASSTDKLFHQRLTQIDTVPKYTGGTATGVVQGLGSLSRSVWYAASYGDLFFMVPGNELDHSFPTVTQARRQELEVDKLRLSHDRTRITRLASITLLGCRI